MPKYRYIGKGPYRDTLRRLIDIEPGQEIETRYILDDNPLFERIADEPAPYSDFSDTYTLNPGESITIDKSVWEGNNTLVAYLLSSTNPTDKGYLYLDQETDETKSTIDTTTTVEIRLDVRSVEKIILKADDSNTGAISIRVSFGWKGLV